MIVDQRMIHGGNRVLPGKSFLRNERTEITNDRAHVAVGQLEPGAGKCICELIGMREEAAGDLFVGRVKAQREVGGEHRRCMALG